MKNLLTAFLLLSFCITEAVAQQDISVSDGNTELTSAVSTFDFDQVFVGDSIYYVFILSNSGDANLTLNATNAVTVSGTDAADFHLLSDSSGYVLTPGEFIGIDMYFKPATAGTKTATLSIDTDDPDEDPFTFTLTGTAGAVPGGCIVPSGDMESFYNSCFPVVDFFSGALTGSALYRAPAGWSPQMSLLYALFGFAINVNETADAHSGSSALELSFDGIGFGDAMILFPCDQQPESLKGYYKFNGAGDDSAYVLVTSGGDGSATDDNTAILLIEADATTYTEFNIVIPYDVNSVDTIKIYLYTTANGTATSFKIDDLVLESDESTYTGFFSGEGSGTTSDPFQVSNATQLDEVRNNLDAHYIQTADIDLDISPYNTGAGWDPIGVLDTVFSGTYDGGGYTIASLFINTGDYYAGLFGMVDGANIKNLILTGVNITGSWYAGAMAGFVKNSSYISNCGSTGSVSGDYNIGGLVGECYNSTITSSFSTASASGTGTIGGLVGEHTGAISDSYARGAVDGDEMVAGLVGRNAGTVLRSYSTGAVTASSSKGGLTFSNTSAPVTNSYWDTETSGQSSSSGGTGMTTALMQKQAFFMGAGWDFDATWGYNAAENGGYPFLRFQGYTHVNLFAGGSGTEGDPWQISTPAQLDDIRYLLNNHFILVADLDLGGDAPEGDFYNGGEGWEPIGSSSSDKFTGSLDGDGYTISNLFIDRSSPYYTGLFGDVYQATISDLTLSGIDVTGQTWTGGLAGHVSSTTINDCSVSGDVHATSSAGGLVGASVDGEVNRVTSSADVTTTDNNCGGIIGYTQGTAVTKAFFYGTVSGNAQVGGIIGYHNYNASLLNSYTTGTASGTAKVGGLVGWNSNSAIEYCYSKGPVSGTTDIGGLIGYYTGGGSTLTASYWDTETSGQSSSAAGTGKTSAEMKSAVTYIPNGWNFDDPWGISPVENGGYPFFRSQGYTALEIFINAGQSYSISETATVGTSVGFVTGVVQNSSGSLQDWQITAGNDDGKFEIVASTGEVKVAASLDHETTTQYTLTLTVSDGTTTSVAEDITIDIEDVDETIPVITASQVFDVDENSTEDTLGIVLATDTDPETVLQDWTITAGNDLGYFALNDSTGHLTLAAGAILDYETTTQYILTLTVGDGTNTSSPETVTININQVNEYPVVDAGLAFSLDENAADGTSVGTVTGTDEDAGTTLQSWTIVSGNEDSNFELNGSTGEITVATGASLHYETAAQYNLMITVSDGTNTSAEEEVIIYIFQGILYVDADATGSDDGGSWANAFNSLQSALAVAGPDQQIWVAEGTYTPSVEYDFDLSGGSDTRESVFEIPDSVEVYGGFNGTETLLVKRDPETNITILSGDLNGDDDGGGDNSENSYHVVFFDVVSDQTVLDGFTITGGNANGTNTINKYGGGIYNYTAAYDSSAPVVRNCIIDNNFAIYYGGGIFNMYHAIDMQAQYINCIISNNSANFDGGGVANYSKNVSCSPGYTNCIFEGNNGGAIFNYSYFNSNSTPTFTNCQILNNTAGSGAGVYDNSVQSPAILAPVYTNCVFMGNSMEAIHTSSGNGTTYNGEFINCTVAGNSAYSGSGFYNEQQSGSTNAPVIKNSIIAGNTDFLSYMYQVNNSSASPTFYYSIIEGSGGSSSWSSTFGTDGGNNLDTDPLFLEPIDGIDAPSPYGNYRLSAGSPAIDAGNNTYNITGEDLDNETRIQNSTIDMGAYEGSTVTTNEIFYVDADASGNNDGSDWANAFTDLENALGKAAGGDEIWVAAGTYYPTSQGSFEGNDASSVRAVTFQLKPGVKLYGGFAGSESSTGERNISLNETILSGDIDQNDQSGGDSTNNAYHVVYLKGADDNTLIDGFTVTRGNANVSSKYIKGGGLRVEGASSESSPQITNCTITGNYGYNGGGLYVDCSAIIRNCTVNGNVGYYGGGLYNSYCSAIIRASSFTNNKGGVGGAVYNSYSDAVFAEVIFSTNSAVNTGGAIYNYYGEPEFINCTIRGNESNDGGGVYNKQTEAVFFNCLITGNRAGSIAGGVRNWGVFPAGSSPEFINTTISGNYAASSGGGMVNTYDNTVITNTIVWNNDAPSSPEMVNYNGYYPVLSYSILDPSISGTDGGNNILTDPQFVTSLDPAGAPSTGGDFTVGAASPAINAGNDAVIPVDELDLDDDDDTGELIPIDLAGNFRQDQAVDIGAYEINEPPEILFINRKEPVEEATNSNTVVYEIILSEPVVNINLADFTLSGTASGTLHSLDETSSTSYEIEVKDVSGDGLLNLDLDAGQDIEDPAGHALSTTIGSEESYFLDNTFPAAPASLDLWTEDDSGDSDTDNITSVNTPRISGTAEYHSEVNLVANGDITMGTAIADDAGDWTITSAALDDGHYSIKATATDTVGNESALSTALSIEIDTTAPVLSMRSSSVVDNTFGPVTFLVHVAGADHQVLIIDSLTLVTDNDVAGDISIDSLTNATVIMGVDNITGSGNFHLVIAAGVFSDVAGNLSRSFNTDEIAIEKDDPGLSLDTITPKTYGDVVFTLSATTGSDGILTFSSSDEEILTVTGDQATVLKAGTVTITVDQAESDNYLAGQDEQVLVIAKASLQVTADDKNKVYGQPNPGLTVSYAGFVAGEDSSVLTTLPMATTAADESSGAGSYDITAGGGVDENYEFSYVTGTLAVSKATLTITAADQERVYGQVNPELTFTYDGFVTGEDSTVLETLPIAATLADTGSGVGAYEITVSGGTDGNYDFSYIPGTLNITKAMLVVTADDQSRIYGQANPELTFAYAGFVNGEDSTVLGTLPVVSTVADVNTGVGTYDITVSGGTDNNYDFSYTAGTLTIAKATLVVTANDQSRLYGQENPELTYTLAGFVNAEDSTVLDTLPVASTSAGAGSDAGSYDISVSGGADDDYTFNYTSGTLTISKAPLMVTADDQSRPYGQPNPVFTITYNGFVNGEDSASLDTLPQAGTAADINSDAGPYAILVSGGSADNYEFSYAPGVLIITQADQVISFDSLASYDMRVTAGFELVATASSGLAVSFGSSDADVATISGTTVTLTGTGTATITAIQAGNINYHAADTVTRVLVVTYNHDPVFVSADTVMFAENGTGVAVNVDANNGDGGAADEGVTYSLTGGYDHYLFTVDVATGEVRYKSTPDFEMPADTNHDNTYELQVTAGDGTYNAYQNIVIIVTDVNEAPVVAHTIADQGFEEGFVSSTLDLGDTFMDEDGDSLVLSASSANEAVVAVSVSGKVLTINEAGSGSAHVTVTADDGHGGTVSTTFIITVNAMGNNPPVVLSAIPDQVFEEGFGSFIIVLDSTFGDTDGDILTLDAVSDHELVVTAEIEGTTLTIGEKGIGSAIVTVTADDGKGGWVTDAFTVTVNPKPNTAPTVVVPVANQSFSEGFISATVNLGGTFTDADGDSLSLTVVSGNEGIITASITGTVLTLTEAGTGSAVITVTANDGRGGSVSDEFLVYINAAGNNNPVLVAGIPDQAFYEGFISSVVGLAHRFTDADGDALTFTATSSDAGVITIAISDTTLTIIEVATGTAAITVTADDGNGGTVTDEFTVEVIHVNVAPVVTNAIADQSYNKDFGNSTLDLDSVFTDADGDTLAFTAASSDVGIVTVAVSGTTLTLSEVDTGTVVVTVTADDGNGGTVADEFTVNVTWVNTKPVFLSGSTYSFLENSNDIVADIDANDGEGGTIDIGISYSISGGDDGSLFTIGVYNGYLYFLTPPNFEEPADLDSNNIYRLNITADDGIDTSILQVSISVQDVNEPPKGFYFNGIDVYSGMNLQINERSALDSLIGVFEVVDEDTADHYSFKLTDIYGNDVTSFYLDGASLRVGDTLNYEDVPYYDLSITVFDFSSVIVYDKYIFLTINDINDPPGKITLDVFNSTEENIAPPHYLGDFTVEDEDCCDSHIFMFFDSDEGDDNAMFSIQDNQLSAVVSFDYEQDSVLQIWVMAMDNRGLSSEPQSFIIKVVDLEDADGLYDATINLRVYPNPVENILLIESSIKIDQLMLMDVNGKVLQITKELIMDVSDLDAGVYILRVLSDNKVRDFKLIKQ